MPSIKKFQLLLPLLTIICLHCTAQTIADQKKEDQNAQLKSLIDSKKYRFHALSATSMKGRTIQLTSEYFLKMNGDSLQVDLPYYGRAYSSGGYPATDPGMLFKTNDFSYVVLTGKNGGWDITIKPKNETRANTIYLSVSAGSYCTVRINSSNRDPISYYGTITDYNAK